jgi:itaconate CoA-transferase
MPVPVNGPSATSPAPLTGITVVSVEQAAAAPFATRQLADLGARVIKVERPGTGDFARSYDGTVKALASYFVWLNRGKQSLSLDLKSAAGRTVLDRLIDRADVFVQNLAPGAAARTGLSADVLLARDERLMVCDIAGYAPDGPFGDRRAYDLLIQCETGLLSVTERRTPRRRPASRSPISRGACTRSARSWPRYTRGSAPASTLRCRCRCSRR